MSKAFTREAEQESTEEIISPRPTMPSGTQNYMTREGADRLRQQLHDLLEQRRPLANEATQANADAKAALRRMEAEIKKLEAMLNSVVTVEPPADREKVALGAAVQVRDEHGEEDTYQIVGLNEADPMQGRISSSSPLGRALLSKRVGDTVRFESPAGPQELTILSVRYAVVAP